jgi:hypothetical protein
MAEVAREEALASKFQQGEKIWSGKSFTQYLGLRPLLSELPVSEKPVPSQNFPESYVGELDFVYAELMHKLIAFESVLFDRALPIKEVSIVPLVRPEGVILQFNITYKDRQGEEATRSFEVIRNGRSSFIFYYQLIYPARPL